MNHNNHFPLKRYLFKKNHGIICSILFFTTFFLFACPSCKNDLQRSKSNIWKTSSLVDENINPELISTLIQNINDGVYQNVHSFLLIKNGKLVVEEYFGESDRDTLHYTASVSKSIGAILIGIAMEQKLFDGIDQGILDKTVSDLFPEYADIIKSDPIKEKILFRHVLSMSAGLEWDEESFPYSDSRNDWNAASHSKDPLKYVLDKPVVADPGTEFNYNGGLTIMLSYLIEKVTGKRADVYAQKHLFQPLGIKDFRWDRIDNGLTDTDGGLYFKPRDMAKLGYLFLKKGVWNGQRIVPEEWIIESTKEHMVNIGSPNYGFQWWCGHFNYNNKSVYTYFASGHGGQKIFVFPSLDTVIVLTHQVFDNPFGELNNTSMLSRYILPALEGQNQKRKAINLEAETLQNYVGKYESAVDQMTISLRDGKLFAYGYASLVIEMVALSKTQFTGTAFNIIDINFEFTLSPDKKVQSVVGTYGFTNKTYKKIS